MTKILKSRWILVAVLALATGAQAQVHYLKLPPDKIEKRLEAAGNGQAERGAFLRSELLASGCAQPNLTDDRVSHQKQPNIVCVVPGKTAKEIVVGAHYDFVDAGRGIVDNWSGASLLPSFVESLKNEQREHTFVFIAFTGEEEGMRGSKSYVSHLSKEQRSAISAMVNIDTLGLSSTKVWATDSSKPLVNVLFNVASMINSPLAVVNVDNVGQSDNDSFREANIPEICIHSATQDTIHILHSRDDQLTAVNKGDYYESYRLIVAYLAVLDASLDKSASESSETKH